MDDDRELLVRGIAAAKAGEIRQARSYLQLFLAVDPPMEAQVEAWNALADIADDDAEKRNYVSRVLAFDPTNGAARRTLAILDGRLKPSELVNPERIAALPPQTAADIHGVTCPQCGSGRLLLGPGATELVCEHCGHKEPLNAQDLRAIRDQDFFAAIWSAKGHRSAERTLTFACNSCGANYLLPPGARSLTCSFCGSVHVKLETASQDLVTPDGLVLFRLAADDVRDALESEFILLHGPFPVYLPAWQFRFAGTVHWSGYRRDRGEFVDRRERISGDEPILDVAPLVAATSQLPESLDYLLDEFDLSETIPFNPLLLAGRPAAAYQLSLDEASVGGRRKAIDTISAEIKEDQHELHGLETGFARMDVDTYKLLLLPFWIASRGSRAPTRYLFVNDQTGSVGKA